MAVEYERALADLNKALPDPNVADSVADILLDIVKARMPGSGTVSTLTAANVNTEVDSGLDTAIPASPTANSVNERIKTVDDDLNNGGRIDLLIDAIKAKTDTIAASPVSTASATTTGVIVGDLSTGTPDVITLATGAANNSFGAWVTMDASTSAISWISNISADVDYAGVSVCVEIGTGAEGSEATKIRLSNSIKGNKSAIHSLSIPIKVAISTRIAARVSIGYTAGAARDVFVGLSMYQSLET